MDDPSTDAPGHKDTSPSTSSKHAAGARPPRPSARLELLETVAALDLPFVRREIAGRRLVFVNDPELISQVLIAHAA